MPRTYRCGGACCPARVADALIGFGCSSCNNTSVYGSGELEPSNGSTARRLTCQGKTVYVGPVPPWRSSSRAPGRRVLTPVPSSGARAWRAGGVGGGARGSSDFVILALQIAEAGLALDLVCLFRRVEGSR